MSKYIPTCEDCYATELCFSCNGTGKQLRNGVELTEDCPHCEGTGVCITCFYEVTDHVEEHI